MKIKHLQTQVTLDVDDATAAKLLYEGCGAFIPVADKGISYCSKIALPGDVALTPVTGRWAMCEGIWDEPRWVASAIDPTKEVHEHSGLLQLRDKPPKTVTITIEVEVKEGATHVAVDEFGRIYCYFARPHVDCGAWTEDEDGPGGVSVTNWVETLTEVPR